MEAERAPPGILLYANFITRRRGRDAQALATEVVEGLFAAIMADPRLLPEDHQSQIPAKALAVPSPTTSQL